MCSAGGNHLPGFVLRGADLPSRRHPYRHRERSAPCAMIAAVKRWYAVVSAILLIHRGAAAADDVTGAARELARKTAAFAGRGASVALTWRNFSSQESVASQARTALEAAFADAGLKLSDTAPGAEARVTVSENAAQFLLVEEAA